MIHCSTHGCKSEFDGTAADAERLSGWRIRQAGTLCKKCESAAGHTPTSVSWSCTSRDILSDLRHMMNKVVHNRGIDITNRIAFVAREQFDWAVDAKIISEDGVVTEYGRHQFITHDLPSPHRVEYCR